MFTEEQKAAVAEMVANQVKAAQEAAKQGAEKGEQNKGDQKTIAQQIKEEIEASKSKSIVDEAKDALKNDREKEVSLNQIQESVKFNISISDFVEKNKELLPEEASKILPAVAAKTFKDENEKANTLRKTFLDSFLEKKENLEVMTPLMKARAENFKGLAESDKERKSGEFWDLVEVGVALKQNARKAEALNKINGVTAGGSSKDILEQKFLAKAREKFNNKK